MTPSPRFETDSLRWRFASTPLRLLMRRKYRRRLQEHAPSPSRAAGEVEGTEASSSPIFETPE